MARQNEDQFIVRFPDGMRDELKEAARENGRSMNAEIIARLSGLDVAGLRDRFAGQAMQAQVATDMVPGEACDALVRAAHDHGQDPIFRLALNSYEIADAMLEARKCSVR